MPFGEAVGQGFTNPKVTQIIVITGTPNSGIFLYQPAPGAGNLVGSWATQAGVDKYGNAYPAGINDQQDLLVGITGQSTVGISSRTNQAFSITSLISGIIQSAIQFTTTDAAELLPGLLGSLLLGTGASTKMSTLLGSPLGNTGNAAYMLLESTNDGNTDTPVITFGTVSSPDAGTTVTYTPILTLTPYAMVVYSGQSGQTVVTKTSGSGNIPMPASAISPGKGECWGSAASGGGGNSVNTGSGGGSGEYAADPGLAFTPGGNIAYVVGAGGGAVTGGVNGHDGAASTLTGSALTVTANGGKHGISAIGASLGGLGGTGSIAPIHHDGGRGGSSDNSSDGGGGASSAGPLAAGNPGGNATGSVGGAGGLPVSGGGAGGKGGTFPGNGSAGTAPGGASGGAASPVSGNTTSPAGANGQVRVTYSTGTPGVMLSISQVAFTDQFGNAIPAAAQYTGADGNVYDVARLSLFLAADTPIPSTSATTLLSKQVGIGTYKIEGIVKGVQGATAIGQFVRFAGPVVNFNDIFIQSNAVGNTSVTDSDLTGALPVDHTTPAWGAGVTFYVRFRGTLTFTATGTFALQGRANSAANQWTAKAASELNLYPVTAA